MHGNERRDRDDGKIERWASERFFRFVLFWEKVKKEKKYDA